MAAVAGARPPCAPVLYVCIPVHNEAATVGVLLWRLRTVLQDAGRDYEVVVYDDASTDATAEVLAPYLRVLPLTVLGGAGAPRRGRSGATEALVRHVAATSRYPRRDAGVLLQGDFTDRVEDLPALLAAFDQGADVVAGRREPDDAQPPAERRLRRMGPWVLRPLVRVEGVDDLLGGLRLFRVATLRDLVRARGAAPVLTAEGWAGAAELLAAAVPFARRVAVVDTPGRYDVRPRPSRLDWAAELRTLARFAWRARGTHARPAAAPSRDEPVAGASPTGPALVPLSTAGRDAASEDDATRPERPRRARSPRPPRDERGRGEAPASSATASGQSGQGSGNAADQPTPRTRERPARPPRRAEVPVADELSTTSLAAPAAERPRVHGRERSPRRPSVAAVDVLAGEAVVARDPSADTQSVGATSPGAAGATVPLGEAADGSPLVEPAVSDIVVPDAADARPGRRRKRRTRRRGRGADSAGPDDGPAAEPDALDAAQSHERANAERPRRPEDAGSAGDHGSDEGAPDDQASDERADTPGGAAGRRRRRRARGRSGEPPSSVPPDAGVRDDDR